MGRKKKDDEIDWKDMPEGYEKYKAYIRSEEWDRIKKIVLDRDGHRCRCCGRTEEEATLYVHHSTYKHLYDEGNHLEDLIVLDRCCHSGIHRVKSNFQRFKKPKKIS